MASNGGIVQEVCPFCAGKGGRYRLQYSVFAGVDAQVHQGAWQTCWSCKGDGIARPHEPHPLYAELSRGT